MRCLWFGLGSRRFVVIECWPHPERGPECGLVEGRVGACLVHERVGGCSVLRLPSSTLVLRLVAFDLGGYQGRDV